jgi:hypothetical protein
MNNSLKILLKVIAICICLLTSIALIISVLIQLGWTGNICLLLLIILLLASAWCVYELTNYLKI